MNPTGRKAIRDYLAMRRGLGFKLVRHEVWADRSSSSFLARKRSSHITVKPWRWSGRRSMRTSTPAEWAARLYRCARLRPSLECDGSVDRSSAARSAAVSAAAGSTILLFPSRNQKTAEGGQNATFD